MAGGLIRYLLRLTLRLSVLAVIAGIYFPIIYIGKEGREPRSQLFVALDQGALFWGSLTYVLTVAIYMLVKARKHFKSVFAVLAWCISTIIFYMSLSDLKPFHKDVIIYENKNQENLIVQYFETGVTGNSRSRLIKTNDMRSSIREYEEILDDSLLDSLHLYDKDFNERTPKSYVVQTDTFYLKKVNSLW